MSSMQGIQPFCALVSHLENGNSHITYLIEVLRGLSLLIHIKHNALRTMPTITVSVNWEILHSYCIHKSNHGSYHGSNVYNKQDTISFSPSKLYRIVTFTFMGSVL